MQSSSLDYRNYNPLYPLYAKKANKGLSIVRIADDARIATVVVRDVNHLVGYEWDRITGRHITVFFKDGTARIHDVFQGGKLMSLLRISTKTVDGAIWDRIETRASSDECPVKFDHDVTKIMPKMIRFARDTRQIFILPYEPPNRAWRLATDEQDGVKIEKQITDIHLVHKENDDLMVMFDGEFVLRLPSEGDHDLLLQAMFPVQDGFYYLFFQEGTVMSLDLGPIVTNTPLVSLIKSFITMSQLSRYFQNHLELIRNDLIAPYSEFLEKVCDRAYGYEQLHEELETLLLTGSVSPELEDWLCNTVNEKNAKKWQKLSLEMYQKSSQILTLAFIPACERLVLLSEACRGFLSAIQVLEKGTITDTSHITDLAATGQSILKLTLETIRTVKSQEVLFQTFWPWFNDRVHEALDEDYKPTIQLDGQCKTGYEIATYLDSQFKKPQPSLHMNDLFKITAFKNALDKFTTKLNSLRNEQIEPYLLRNCAKTTLGNHILKNDPPHTLLAATAPFTGRSLIICFLTGTKDKLPWLSMRLLDKTNLDRATDDIPIQLPLGLEDRPVETVLITKVSDKLQPDCGSTNISFQISILHAQEDKGGASPAPQLLYNCEITADLHIASLTMQETTNCTALGIPQCLGPSDAKQSISEPNGHR